MKLRQSWGGPGRSAGALLCAFAGVCSASLLAFPFLPPTLLSKYQFHTLVLPFQCCVLQVPGGGLWLGCHGDLLTAEEIAALLFCYL